MKRGEGGAAVALWLALGAGGAACGHAHTTDKGAPGESAAEEPAPHHHHAGATKREPGDTPVAESPNGLLKPGAEEKIREKLQAGDDEPLSKALKQFQRDHDLPVTGQPDHETVSKLGLPPDDIFLKATPQ